MFKFIKGNKSSIDIENNNNNNNNNTEDEIEEIKLITETPKENLFSHAADLKHEGEEAVEELLLQQPQKQTWFHLSYLLDWGLSLLILVIGLAITEEAISPPHMFLPDDDKEFAYPLLSDTVPVWLLIILSLVFPTFLFVLAQAVFRSTHDLHNAVLGLLETITFTMTWTDIIKVSAGRYRPDYLARVQQQNDVVDGRKSFPSGHSSLSFCAMTYLSLYLAGKLGLFRRQGGAVWKAVIAMLPLSLSVFVAVSRTRDYHHHFSDILGGAVIGVALALFFYVLNYESLFGDRSQYPKRRNSDAPIYYLHK